MHKHRKVTLILEVARMVKLPTLYNNNEHFNIM